MQKMTYVQVSSLITYYLEMYPHVGVALEATLEDVEGDGVMAKEVRSAMEQIYGGKSDVEVLAAWADKTGSRDLETLSTRIKEAREKGEDIGLYLRRFAPKVPTKKDNNGPKRRNGKKPYRGNNGRKRNFNKKD